MTLLFAALIVLSAVTTLLTPFLTSCCTRRSKQEKRLEKIPTNEPAAASLVAGSSGRDVKADEVIKTDKTQEETEPTQENSGSAPSPCITPVKSRERIERS